MVFQSDSTPPSQPMVHTCSVGSLSKLLEIESYVNIHPVCGTRSSLGPGCGLVTNEQDPEPMGQLLSHGLGKREAFPDLTAESGSSTEEGD